MSLGQKFVNSPFHILPECIHGLAFEPVLIIPQAYPQLPCKGVCEHQHGTVTLARTGGQRVKLDIRELRVFIGSIQISEERKPQKRDRWMANGWRFVRRRRWRRGDPDASLLFVVFLRPQASLLPT